MIRFAEAVLQAEKGQFDISAISRHPGHNSPEIMINSSIRWSLIDGGLGDCRIKQSSSRTDEWI